MHKSGSKYVAQFRKTKGYIGTFSSELEAAMNYNIEAEKYFGKYALLNKVFEDVSEEIILGEA